MREDFKVPHARDCKGREGKGKPQRHGGARSGVLRRIGRKNENVPTVYYLGPLLTGSRLCYMGILALPCPLPVQWQDLTMGAASLHPHGCAHLFYCATARIERPFGSNRSERRALRGS